MIDLVYHFQAMEPESCGGIPERPLFFAVGLCEITLLVVGILTVLEVGPFAGLTTEYAIGFFAAGGALVGLDIARLITHVVRYGKKDEVEAYEDSTLAGGIEPEACQGANYSYTLNLRLLCQSSKGDTRSHVYPVFALSELVNLTTEVGKAHVLYFENPGDYSADNVAIASFGDKGMRKHGKLFSTGGTLPPFLARIRNNTVTIYSPV